MKRFPPDVGDIDTLADFFDRTSITEMAGLEELKQKPRRDLVSVTVRLPLTDVLELKRRAKRFGFSYSSLVRAAVRKYIDNNM